MNVVNAMKTAAFSAAVTTALNYLEKDPETNIPKILELIDRAAPDGWYEGQRAAFRKAIAEKSNWYQLILKAYELDAGVRKTFFQNFIINASLKGGAIQEELKEREGCNIPWAILLDPTSACNLHYTGCWAAEYGRTDPRQYHHDAEKRADYCCGVIFQSQQHRNIPRQAAQTGS